jgi:putative heme iron utilization protein
MSPSPITTHIYDGAVPKPVAPLPVPTHAEYARSLAATYDRGTLSTLNEEGYPFGSLVLYVLDDRGQPVMLLSELAEHTKNIRRDGRASVLVSSSVMPGDDPMALPRVTLVGSLVPVERETQELAVLQAQFLAEHPSAESYVAFGDFGWWRLALDSVRFVGGYGRMSWVDVDAYMHVQPDPLARHGDAIMAHMNTDHADANLAYARALAGIANATSARMVAVDRLGFDLLASTPDGLQPARVNFDEPVDTPDAVRKAVVALLARARALLDVSPP